MPPRNWRASRRLTFRQEEEDNGVTRQHIHARLCIDGSGTAAGFRELQDLTIRLLRSYREQEWARALETIKLCRKAAERFGIGALYDMYAERIDAFRRNPPPADWNGVYEAESK